MGKNGSGKTTLIKCLMGMEGYSGTILFNDKPVDYSRNECLVIWDDCPFYSNLTGLENLILFGEKKKSKNDISNIAKTYLSYEILKHPVKTYSYGQKKKLGIVLVEILEPKFLFMDEISNGLDFDIIRHLQQRIRDWAERSTIVLTGHHFDFYSQIIDDLFIFQNKEILPFKNDFSASKISLEEIYDQKIG
jgi:ABC-2 type transport system ATP-binding protein